MTSKTVTEYLKERKAWQKGDPRLAIPAVKFTKAAIDGLPVESFDYEVRDTEIKQLRCRVRASGSKTFVIVRRPKGGSKPVRVTLCAVGDMLIDSNNKTDKTVRKTAMAALADLASGENPIEKQRAEGAAKAAVGVTLQDALDNYLKNPKLKENTKTGYKRTLEIHLAGWLKKPLSEITPDMVKAKHQEISKTQSYAANNAMRIFRAVWNLARDENTGTKGELLLPECPTRILKRTWNQEKRRRGQVEPEDLKAWFDAVLALPQTMNDRGADGSRASDYLQFVILTGLRRREATSLTWNDINLKAKTFDVTDTKNNTPLTLPLSDYLVEILERRKKASKSKGGPFQFDEPKRFVNKVREESGITFTIHDLRRSFIGYAEDCDLGLLTIKALVNHTVDKRGGDVTEGYHIATHRRLRDPMQKITDYVLGHAGVSRSNVVDISEAKHGKRS